MAITGAYHAVNVLCMLATGATLHAQLLPLSACLHCQSNTSNSVYSISDHTGAVSMQLHGHKLPGHAIAHNVCS